MIAYFSYAKTFEPAVHALEKHGIRWAHINLIGSQNSVREKLGHYFVAEKGTEADRAAPQAIFTGRRETDQGKTLAVGLPVYIGVAIAGVDPAGQAAALGLLPVTSL